MLHSRAGIIGFILIAIAALFFLFRALPAHADPGPVISPNGPSYLFFPQLQYNYPSPYYQTAFKDGDQTYVFLQATSDVPVTGVTADISTLGGSSSFPVNDTGGHNYQSDFFTVATEHTTGNFSIAVAATDANGVTGTNQVSVTIDNTPPTITSAGTIATTTIVDFTPLYLSGSIDGTGSQGRIFSALVHALNSNGVALPGAYDAYGYPQSQALKDLRNGAFSNVSIPIFPSVFNDFNTASKFQIDFLVKDEAGNIGTTTTFVSIPTIATSTGASSVLFLPGIEGSRLSALGVQLWPPPTPAVFADTLSSLALRTDGSSIAPVKVDGIVNTFYTTPLYSGFSSFMDSMVASTTVSMREWKPLAYDWRYSPESIVANGIQTSDGTEYPVAEVEKLAARSNSGKVTIIGHSYGGLVGKALIKALEEKGEANLIDSFVMVGTPQLGTPQAVAGLLQGDDEAIPGGFPLFGVIVNPASAHDIGKNFQSAYDLLPSSHYFDEVDDPVLRFDSSASFTQSWSNYWGPTIDTYSEFVQFLTGTGVSRSNPLGFLYVPDILRSDLISRAQDYHTVFDNYAFPPSVRVVQIAGWGLPTTKAISYTNSHFLGLPTAIQGYEVVPTIEGDNTVVYTSAVSSQGEDFFFNLQEFRKSEKTSTEHKDLLNAAPVEEVIKSLLLRVPVGSEVKYITTTKPMPSVSGDHLVVSTRSPIILGVYDAVGNFTGVNPTQNLNSQFLSISEDIPGSSFLSSSAGEYIFLPKNGTYRFEFKGIGSGPATIKTGVFSNDVITPATINSDMPVTTLTSATFTVDSVALQDTHIQVDQNGDGIVDTIVASEGGTLSLDELVTNLSSAVQTLSIKDKLKTQLVNKITNLKSKIEKQRQKQSTVLARLKAQIDKKASKGKIDTAAANALSVLLDELIAQDSTISLDSVLIQSLKDQINAASITQALKNTLLAKVARVENLSGIERSLDTATRFIAKKGALGLIPDTDVQNLLTLLDQIQSAL